MINLSRVAMPYHFVNGMHPKVHSYSENGCWQLEERVAALLGNAFLSLPETHVDKIKEKATRLTPPDRYDPDYDMGYGFLWLEINPWDPASGPLFVFFFSGPTPGRPVSRQVEPLGLHWVPEITIFNHEGERVYVGYLQPNGPSPELLVQAIRENYPVIFHSRLNIHKIVGEDVINFRATDSMNIRPIGPAIDLLDLESKKFQDYSLKETTPFENSIREHWNGKSIDEKLLEKLEMPKGPLGFDPRRDEGFGVLSMAPIKAWGSDTRPHLNIHFLKAGVHRKDPRMIEEGLCYVVPILSIYERDGRILDRSLLSNMQMPWELVVRALNEQLPVVIHNLISIEKDISGVLKKI